MLFLFIGCSTDDSELVPLEIVTKEDVVVVLQNSLTEIDVFFNDINIPESGSLVISAPLQGTVEKSDANTPNNPKDDIVVYTALPNFTGQDSFEYTICTADNSQCETNRVVITVETTSEVIFDENIPYPKLSSYNFFKENIADHTPNTDVLPFKPASTLFTDYALKKRFIWMPNNTAAKYTEDHTVLDLPVGAILIKAFYYENVLPENKRKNIETRLMIKKEEGWVFANYVWNEAQTEAFLDNQGSTVTIEWMHEGAPKEAQYIIPSRELCITCHGLDNTLPLGIKPQNLNFDYLYEDGYSNQLKKLTQIGYLENTVPENITSVVDWEDVSQNLEMRIRSYVDINCAHCHSDDNYCYYRSLRFAFNYTDNFENMGVCKDADFYIPPNDKIVSPKNKDISALYFRVNTAQTQYRMPLLGRTLIHEEFVNILDEWINSLPENCE